MRAAAVTRRKATWTPATGDVILRWLGGGAFDVVEAETCRHLTGPVSLSRAIALAKASGAAVIWQQNLDERGRPVGTPYRIPLAVGAAR